MSVFKRDSTGDLDRGPNGLGFSRVMKQEEARVWLETVLRLVQTEVKRDVRSGLDHEYLFDPLVSGRLKANHIASVMVSVPGITDAEVDFSLVTETGVLRVTANVTYDEADQQGRTSRVEQVLVDVSADLGGARV